GPRHLRDPASRADHRAADGRCFGRKPFGRAKRAGSHAMSDSLSRRYAGSAVTRAISVWGLLVLLILLIVVFSLLLPNTFPTYFNVKSILNNKSVQAMVALAVFIPMTANHFDLSAGFNLGISQVLAIGLQGQGLPWWGAVAAVLLMGALVGFVNG